MKSKAFSTKRWPEALTGRSRCEASGKEFTRYLRRGQPNEHGMLNFPMCGKGEAFLTGPGHSPFDGEAHYFCWKHLDKDATIAEGISDD